MPNRVHFPHVSPVKAIADISHWVTDKIAAIHSESAVHLQVKHLRELDHHILWDMGINRAALYDFSPKIEKFHFDGELPDEDDSKH
jgi:hypothetical protein